MKEMGLEFEILTADIDESSIRREKPEDLVMALAEAKAQAILARLATKESDADSAQQTLLITADQVVVHEGNILEKPRTSEEARRFIEGYSRSPARTVGAVLVTNLSTGVSKGGVDTAEIYFHSIPEHVITTLIEEGSVFWAAGGLLVEHPLVSPLVNAMVGTIDSVMGLPKELTLSLIDEAVERTK
ncbi:hypothetical protein MPTK1_7g12230 [Marchantia polymorpha subsp. ruderalis]|nr:hypothetical protein MARPO_0003s0236 [Marchantia polymorpha]BBN17130.1 hypothetical protein Mp_7g12230 [Marchantia polymorpha subsp. ruderalis]|eukprot:PTQ49368.1 hypothetical protein MARPO_0003s0236 [Marchantia polymorpha]